MKNSIYNYDVTYIALEHFRQRSFEISFDLFTHFQSSEEPLVKEFILIVGLDEIYELLNYHVDLLLSVFVTKKYSLIDYYFQWKYCVYASRGLNLDYFLIEFQYWKESISNHLYLSHSSEINIVFDYLLEKHSIFKATYSRDLSIEVNTLHVSLFNELKQYLLNSQTEDFFHAVEKSLPNFDNNIFHFIEEIIDPLMYTVGFMWQYNEISVAKEHLATSMTSEIIDRFLKNNVYYEKKPTVLISTVAGELHNLGIKIVGRFLESLGFDVKQLGTKLKDKELLNSVYSLNPDILMLSVTLPSNLFHLVNIVQELKNTQHPFNGIIIAGGQALYTQNEILEIKGIDYISKNLEDLKIFLNKIEKN